VNPPPDYSGGSANFVGVSRKLGPAMRFILLAAGAAMMGALVESLVISRTATTFEVARELGGNMANFKVADINPVKAYYNFMQEVASGELGRGISLPKSPIFSWSPINPENLNSSFRIDDRAIQRAFANGINSRIQQDIRRAQDLAAYGRNPMGWHGAPPY
jgi:hypothetical protein